MGSHRVPGVVCGGGRGLFRASPAPHDHCFLRQETLPPQEREQAPSQTQVCVAGVRKCKNRNCERHCVSLAITFLVSAKKWNSQANNR